MSPVYQIGPDGRLHPVDPDGWPGGQQPQQAQPPHPPTEIVNHTGDAEVLASTRKRVAKAEGFPRLLVVPSPGKPAFDLIDAAGVKDEALKRRVRDRAHDALREFYTYKGGDMPAEPAEEAA